MNYSLAVFLINENTRGILATYEAEEKSNRTFFKTLDPGIMVDDLVLVPTDTRHKVTVVKVVEVDVEPEYNSTNEFKWIIGKVDQSAHQRLLAQEQQAVAKIKQAHKAKERRELAAAMLADADELKTLSITTSDIENPVENS